MGKGRAGKAEDAKLPDPSLPLAFKIARAFGKNVEEVFLYPEEQNPAQHPKV